MSVGPESKNKSNCKIYSRHPVHVLSSIYFCCLAVVDDYIVYSDSKEAKRSLYQLSLFLELL